jgi:hypothetical protein
MFAGRAYLLAVTLLTVLGGYLVSGGFSAGKAPLRFRASPSRTLRNLPLMLRDKSTDEIFRDAGVNLSVAKYQGVRNLLIVAVMLFLAANAVLGEPVLRQVLLFIVLYAATKPDEYFTAGKRKIKTPFKTVLDAMRKTHFERLDNELSKAVVQLKNMIATNPEKLYATDYVLEQLMKYTRLTRPTFARTIMLYRKGEKEAAAELFTGEIKTKLGRDFGMIVLKLENLPPKDFMTQIEAFQVSMREERQTRELQKGESTSRRIFLLASITVMVIIFDYMYILFAHLMKEMAVIG